MKKATAKKRPRARAAAVKDPATMSAGDINKELDKLDVRYDKNLDGFLEAGRGHERPSDYKGKTDPLSREADAIFSRRMDIRREIERRCGPGASSRLPSGRGYGPIKSRF